MDQNTNIHELKLQVKKFCHDREWDQFHNAKDLAIAITGEAAELLDLFRFKNEIEIMELFEDEKKREKIEDELADIFYCVLRFADKNNLDLTESLKNKMLKNEKKYPVEHAKGSNKKYSEYQL